MGIRAFSNGNLVLGTDYTDFTEILIICYVSVTPSVAEGSHIMLSHALREMSRQARHDRDTLSKSVTNPCNPCLKTAR